MPRSTFIKTILPISGTHEYWQPPHDNQNSPSPSRRLKIFVIAFITSAVLTLGYVFSQPAIYLSYATLLTVAKTEIDLPSSNADIQHVAIQKQVLLGSELLTETSKRLKTSLGAETKTGLNASEIRQMLDVRPVADTNLVEMTAEGPDPESLPLLINTWIDVYLDARAAEAPRLLGDTTQTLQNELDELTKKIRTKRATLDAFRKQHDIASIEREENEALARLRGLNESLNDANEAEVLAKAKLDAISKAIKRGQAVVPQEDTRTLSLLEDRAQVLREELAELNLRYTQEFLNLSPELKVIPEQLQALEEEIKRMRRHGQTVVQSDAEQEYAAAKQTADAIRQQLAAHKKEATTFSGRFAEHEALRNDLESLESLYRNAQERKAQVEAKYAGKYPQVDVVERAFLPTTPERPDYWINAGIAVAASILFSLICIWIIEFLTRKNQPQPIVNLAGVHVLDTQLTANTPDLLDRSIETLPTQKPLPTPKPLPTQNLTLESTPPQEINSQSINTLLHEADDREKLLIALLLSGASPEEITMIKPEDIDLEHDRLFIRNKPPRTIPLSPVLKSLLANTACRLVHPSGEPLSTEDLVAMLARTVAAANLTTTESINAASLRQTYLIYLVKQGIRLTELEKIAGYIPPTELSGYSVHQPAGFGYKRSLQEIDWVYPALHHV